MLGCELAPGLGETQANQTGEDDLDSLLSALDDGRNLDALFSASHPRGASGDPRSMAISLILVARHL